ncbi:MAG: hypothetical protein HYU67_12880 [Flavobacteriia bacterium]|nr:hypothetical protein [Flavobacteriia bacterium]
MKFEEILNMETKNLIKTNIHLFDDKIKLIKESDLVLFASYHSIWNTQLFINLALEIAKTTEVMFFSCKYEMETIEKFFTKTLLKQKMHDYTLPFDKSEQLKALLELCNLKLKIQASKKINYHKIWNESIEERDGI